MSEKESKSVIEGYLQKLRRLIVSEGNYAYRGQENADWGVESGAFRRLKETNPNPSKEDFVSYHEKELLEHARMNGYGVEEGRKLSDLELLAKLEHYGAATCLIDFTRNFLVAMWFACQSHREKGKEKNGKIFILNTIDEKNFLSLEEKDLEKKVRDFLEFQTHDETTSSKETTIFSILKPSWWHWSPQGLIQRSLKQDSLFIFGQPKIENTLLQEIEILHRDKDKILEELERLGIIERTLFKDLPGFAERHGYNRPLPLGYGNAEYYLRKGNEALQRGDAEGAIADFDRVLELKPDFAEAYNTRGNAKSDLDEHSGAMADYARTIELKPDYAEAYYNRGNAKANLGDYSGAMADYDQAIELKPDLAVAYNNRGMVKFILGEPCSAMADYDRAIELKPDDAKAYNDRGSVKFLLGDNYGAIADYDRAIELKPDFAKAYYKRGLDYASLGDKEKARRDFLKARELAEQSGKDQSLNLIDGALSELDNEWGSVEAIWERNKHLSAAEAQALADEAVAEARANRS